MPPRSAIVVCLFAVLTTMTLVTASVAQEPSAPSAGAVELSKLVVQHPEFRGYFEGLVRSELDPRMGSDFGIAYLQRSDVIWSTLQTDLAISLAARLSEEELGATLAGFKESAVSESVCGSSSRRLSAPSRRTNDRMPATN